MDFCYRFKRMCKEADSALKLVPTTKTWPEALEFPKFPDESPFQLLIKADNMNDDEYGQIVEILNGGEGFSIANNVQPELLDTIVVDEDELVAQQVEEGEIVAKSKTPKQVDIIYTDKVEKPSPKKPARPPPLPPPSPKTSPPIANPRKRPLAPTKSTSCPSPPQKVLNQIFMVAKPTKPIPAETAVKINKFGDIVMSEAEAEVLETDVFPCSSCDRSFPLKQLLEIHERNHNRDRESACELCPKRFFTKYDLAKVTIQSPIKLSSPIPQMLPFQHMTTHTGERPFQCVVCNKAFSRSTLLHRHQKIHIDEPRFECPNCDRFFFVREELEKHAEKHKKARPFGCTFCPKSFAFKQGLERHEIVHAESQPFPCEYCEASFNTRNRLLRHLTAHAGTRPFPCKYCAKSYLMSHHLSRHLRSHAAKEDICVVYTCYRCQQEFDSAEMLVDHMVEEHQDHEDHVCPLCYEKFDTAEENRLHVQLHMDAADQFACEFCDLIFLDEEKLLTHSQDDHADDHRIYDEDMANNVKKERDASKLAAAKESGMVVATPSTSKKTMGKLESPSLPKKEGQQKINELLKALPKSMSVKRNVSETSKIAPEKVPVKTAVLRTYGGAASRLQKQKNLPQAAK